MGGGGVGVKKNPKVRKGLSRPENEGTGQEQKNPLV